MDLKWKVGDILYIKARPRKGGVTVVVQATAMRAGEKFSGPIQVAIGDKMVTARSSNVFAVKDCLFG